MQEGRFTLLKKKKQQQQETNIYSWKRGDKVIRPLDTELNAYGILSQKSK